METLTGHLVINLPSDTYDGHFPHDEAASTDCRRCIADRAVLSALGGK